MPHTSNPPPKGWPRISSAIYYDDGIAAIDWLCEAFGFEVRMRVLDDDGNLLHSELDFGEGMIMVGQSGNRGGHPEFNLASPKSHGGANTQSLCLVVDDADAHCERARKAGAKIIMEPATQDYGEEYWADRTYGALDPEGHLWWFMHRVRG